MSDDDRARGTRRAVWGRPPRVLHLLLGLYPPRHRRAYGEEMWEVVRHRHARAGGGARFLAATAWDLARGALGVWMTTTRRKGTMTRREERDGDRDGRRIGSSMGGWGLDLRFVARSLARSPGYTATCVTVLAAAVAVTVTVLAFVRGTLLDQPTYPGSERLVVAWGSNVVDGQLRDVISGPNYIDLRRGTRSLEALAAFHGGGAILEVDGRPEVFDAQQVSVDFFRVVPVEPALGRVFDDRDRTSSGPAVTVVSHGFWRDRLEADPGWVGRALWMNGEPHTILGILPEDFEFLYPAEFWLPLRDDELAADERSRIHYHLFGRLRPGATAADATRELTARLGEIELEHPGLRGWSVLAEPMDEAAVLSVRGILWALAAAVGLVLLITLVNLATLFRIRTLGRHQELSVRRALGASGARVTRVLVLEACGLGLAGSLAGLALAPALLARVRGMVPLWIPIPDSAAQLPALRALLDPWVAGVTVAGTLVGTVLLVLPGLGGALRSRDAARAGRGVAAARGTGGLVAVELALATVLCLGAGLTTRSAARLLATDVGVRDEGLLTLYVGDVWERPVGEQIEYFREVVERVRRVPGVAAAGVIDYVPFEGEDDYARVYFLDRSFQPVESLREEWRRVGEGLFETAGMRIVRGRSLEPVDFEGTPRAAVVNEAFAAKHYPDRPAVGELMSTHDEAYRDFEIVGVVADVRSNGPAEPAPPMLYVPYQGSPRGTTGLYVRVTSGDPIAVLDPVREAIWSVDASQPITRIRPMSALVGARVAIPRAARSLVAALATLALALAAVGVFGVVAYGVRTRRAELAVRLALGASPERIRRDAMMGAVPLIVLGVGSGLVGGILAARGARALLYGLDPLDPVAAGLALAAMAGIALLATWLPARRVATIDAMEAMRD